MDITKAAIPATLFAVATYYGYKKMKAAGANDNQMTQMLGLSVAYYAFGVWAGRNMYK